MNQQKLRVTGFTRFLLVMIVVLPLAYFGASSLTGESIDFKKEFNKLIGKEVVEEPKKEDSGKSESTKEIEKQKPEPTAEEPSTSTAAPTETAVSTENAAPGELSTLKNQVYNLEQKLELAKKQLETKDTELQQLKADLAAKDAQIQLYRERDALKAKLEQK